MWTRGTIGVKDSNGRMVSVSYWIKHYEEPSEEYGISGGRISKLIKEMMNQTIGVEVEMNNITRTKAAQIAADFFETRLCLL